MSRFVGLWSRVFEVWLASAPTDEVQLEAWIRLMSAR